MFGRDVLVFELIGFLEGALEDGSCRARKPRLLDSAARLLRQGCNLTIDGGGQRLGSGADLAENRDDDTLAVSEQRSQKVQRAHFGVTVFSSRVIRGLDRFLRLDGEFVPADR